MTTDWGQTGWETLIGETSWPAGMPRDEQTIAFCRSLFLRGAVYATHLIVGNAGPDDFPRPVADMIGDLLNELDPHIQTWVAILNAKERS